MEVLPPMALQPGGLSPSQQAMVELWDRHLRCAFVSRNLPAVMDTLIEHPVCLNVPSVTGGVGYQAVQDHYRDQVLLQLPPDTALRRLTRTVGGERLVDELLLCFTHSLAMDWLLPGLAPTGRRVELPLVASVRFADGLIAAVHLYWDQASALVQLGLLAPAELPVARAESVSALLDRTGLPTTALLARRPAWRPASHHHHHHHSRSRCDHPVSGSEGAS